MILVAGPYRSGTNNDARRMAENLGRLEMAALTLYKKGHLPVIGEWVALPLMKRAGMKTVGDGIYEEFAYAASHRLLRASDAVLRIQGVSNGADADVTLAKQLGIPVYFSLDEVPVPQS